MLGLNLVLVILHKRFAVSIDLDKIHLVTLITIFSVDFVTNHLKETFLAQNRKVMTLPYLTTLELE